MTHIEFVSRCGAIGLSMYAVGAIAFIGGSGRIQRVGKYVMIIGSVLLVVGFSAMIWR